MNSPRGSTDSVERLKVPPLTMERMMSVTSREDSHKSEIFVENLDQTIPKEVHNEEIVATGMSIEENDDLKEVETTKRDEK